MAEHTDFFNLKAYGKLLSYLQQVSFVDLLHFDKKESENTGKKWNLYYYADPMVIDYTGSFSSFSGHQANLYANPNNSNATPFSTNKAITDYLQRGVPARKIVLGMPAYGRSFRNTAGIGQVFMNSNNMTDVYKYNALPKYGATEIVDLASRASYSFDFASGELVSYDTVSTVQMKTTYIHRKKLAGSMLWEASGDRNRSYSLIDASYAALGRIDMTLNLLSYPLSRYSNIAAGMPEEQN